MDRIGGCRAPVWEVTVQRLEHLLRTLRAGARARAELSELDSELLRAGVAAWADRQRDRSAAATRQVPVVVSVAVSVMGPA